MAPSPLLKAGPGNYVRADSILNIATDGTKMEVQLIQGVLTVEFDAPEEAIAAADNLAKEHSRIYVIPTIAQEGLATLDSDYRILNVGETIDAGIDEYRSKDGWRRCRMGEYYKTCVIAGDIRRPIAKEVK